MPPVIIADASCLILLDKIGALDLLLKLYGTVIVTEEIADEFNEPLPRWIQIKKVENKNQQLVLETILDKGEASAIALALEFTNSLLIIDERKGRKLASQLDLKIIGSLALIIEAKRKGYITAVKPILEKIAATNFYISEHLKSLILRNAEE